MICDDCGEDRDDVEEVFVGDYGEIGVPLSRELCEDCVPFYDMPDEDTSDLKTDESDGGYV